MNDSGHLLAAMPVPRAFFKLEAPAVAAQGKTLVSMGNAAIGAAANIVLDAALICGFHLGVQGAQPLLSYNPGAENIPRVKRTFRLLLICCVSGSFLIWLLCTTAPMFYAYYRKLK